jgi:ubiquitin-like 1-activating enzyme E1 B
MKMVNLKQYLSPSALSREFQIFFHLLRLLRSSHYLYCFRPNHPVDDPAMILPDPLPEPAKRPKLVISQPSSRPSTPLRVQKRPAPDNVDEVQPAKRARIAIPLHNHSPSKSRRLEEDGLILLDGNRSMDDIDIVVID